ncbi:MAG TPA: inositol-3-phosphate synthase [Vicinamibacteria bacterium]|nr:inositol-3-phosphate synthase [Vicinamibacteria bacterium]
MMKEQPRFEIAPPEGGLVVLLPGLGAVSTTFIAGIQAVRRGLAKPIGSLTQMGTIRLGKRTEKRAPRITDFVPLASLEDLSFAAWDIFEEDGYLSAVTAGVLERALLNELRADLEAVRPMKAVFDQSFVKKLHGTHVKAGKSKMDLAEQLMEDIDEVKRTTGCSRATMIWCASTETYLARNEVHEDVAAFERGLKESSPEIAPSMIYAYAALKCGVPYFNGAPNLTVDVPALTQLSYELGVPIGGKDFKTGQTLLKTILAPGLKARMLGLSGWFSSNILGNRDGEVLDDPGSFKTKEESKLSVLEYILQPELYPDLYDKFYHKVRINYYPPRGDNKEGWDNIDIFGWLGYPMQIKVDFLCRDSILAAPLVLDLALFSDLAARAGFKGIQEWLSFYFKSPMSPQGVYPEHDLFIQLTKLKNTLRYLMGEDQITHLGEYVLEHDPTKKPELVSE